VVNPEELFRRVREDAASIAELVATGTNIPLEQYVDKASVNALCDSLGLDADAWKADDLERILIIRDGLYTLRHKLRDLGDDAEHSVDRLLSSVDRLYADLERAFRELNQEALKKAQAEVAALQRGPQITASITAQTTTEMRKEASEVLVQAHTSIRHIEINLLKIDRTNVNFEILRNMKLTVQKMSASVFAIKLSLEQKIIYQGIFKLLTDGADKIVGELKGLLHQLQSSYDKAADFVAELGKLADKGTRFARLVAEFLNKAFARAESAEVRAIKLGMQVAHQGDAILAASADSKGRVILASKSGDAWNGDPANGRIVPRFRVSHRAVYSLSHVEDELLAVGTDEGLEVIGTGKNSEEYGGSFRERVIAIATPQWGAKGSRGTIITGSRDGFVRRWSLAGGELTLYSSQAYEQVGRRMHCMTVTKDEIIAATGHDLVFLNRDMRTTRTTKVPFEVNGIDVIDNKALVLCGEGRITHVNLESGIFSRIITASETSEYSCVAARDVGTFFFGTTKGRVGIMELASGEELGSVEVGFEVRGLLPVVHKVLAYGGAWEKRSRSAAFLTMEDVSHAAADSAGQRL
jgi:hypothetical protein